MQADDKNQAAVTTSGSSMTGASEAGPLFRRRGGDRRFREPALGPGVAIVLSTFLWGTIWIPLRRLDEAGLSGAWATTAGFLLPLLFLLPFGFRHRRRIAAGGPALFASGFLLAAAIALYAEALLRGTVARAILLFYLTPVWSTLLARFMLGEPVHRRRLVTIALGLAGLTVILGKGAQVPMPRMASDWMALVAGFCWGLAMVYLRRTRDVSDVDKVFVQFLFLGAIFFFVALWPGGRNWVLPSMQALGRSAAWLVAFALCWMTPVLWLTMFGGSRIEPGRVALLLMLEVIIGLVSAAVLTVEPFAVRELVGAVLVVGACGGEFLPAPSARGPA